MKTIQVLVLFSGLILLSIIGSCQQQNAGEFLQHLPENWELIEESPNTYQMTTIHYDYLLLGSFFNKTQISGRYTRGLEGSKVKWNDVYISQSNSLEEPFSKGEKQAVMENFTYAGDEDMISGEKIKDLPPNSHFIKNLVWDMMAFETFAWQYTDSLELNKKFIPQELNVEMDLAGEGTFENKEIWLTWTGISMQNNVRCAILKFSVMNNPLSIETDYLKMKGRSHYWGEVYVSLESKELEYCELFEDVVSDMTISGQENPMMLNTVRTIVVERVQ